MLDGGLQITRGTARRNGYRGTATLVALVASILFPTSGCQKKAALPDTYPVQGKVAFPDGQPVSGGGVMMQLLADTTISCTGVIGPDGTFTVTSFRDNVRRPGACAGQYRVMVTPPVGQEREAMPYPMTTFDKPYTIQQGENPLSLTVERPSR